MKDMYKKGGKKKPSKKMPSKKAIKKEAAREKESFMEESKELAFGSPKRPAPMQQMAPQPQQAMGQGQMMMKKGGAKSMEPGGGGRFAKLVSKLKSKGKSTDSAKAIAASVGRKKYGKSKFQAMAAAGKKKMGGANC